MRIIDNKKDYYDYLSGIYGIDPNIVYDRRGSTMIDPKSCTPSYQLSYLFSEKNYSDKPRTLKHYYSLPEWHKPEEKKLFHQVLCGEYHYFILEAGFQHFLFEIERYIDDDGNHRVIPMLIKQTEGEKYVKDAPLAIIYKGTYSYRLDYKPTDSQIKDAIRNPIITQTYIPRFIPPETIWQNIYNYLSSLKDKPITDNRSDTQKLESAGFDKKTSFRNIK